MKFSKMLATTIAVSFLATATAFASPDIPATPNAGTPQQKSDTLKTERKHLKEECKKQRQDEFNKDPIKMLNEKKEKVQSLLKEGKISKEEANAIIKRIDSRITEIQKFNSLTLTQKKEKLVKDFKTAAEKKVKEGKLTQDRADTMIKEFTEKVKAWDGNGYPQFHGKWFKDKGKHHGTDVKQ